MSREGCTRVARVTDRGAAIQAAVIVSASMTE